MYIYCLYDIWNENKTRILIITFYIPLQIYKHSFFSWFINEKKETYSDNLYVIFWKFILTLIYSFSENNICKTSMTFISASSEMSRNVCSGKHFQMQVWFFFFHFKSGKPIVVIILSLMMLFYIYTLESFFFLGCDCQFFVHFNLGILWCNIWLFFFSFFMDKNIFIIHLVHFQNL